MPCSIITPVRCFPAPPQLQQAPQKFPPAEAQQTPIRKKWPLLKRSKHKFEKIGLCWGAANTNPKKTVLAGAQQTQIRNKWPLLSLSKGQAEKNRVC
jgi:hypothetical protein